VCVCARTVCVCARERACACARVCLCVCDVRACMRVYMCACKLSQPNEMELSLKIPWDTRVVLQGQLHQFLPDCLFPTLPCFIITFLKFVSFYNSFNHD